MGAASERDVSVASVNDARDEADTGKPPCDFCRREPACSCHLGIDPARVSDGEWDAACMCSCGRCMA